MQLILCSRRSCTWFRWTTVKLVKGHIENDLLCQVRYVHCLVAMVHCSPLTLFTFLILVKRQVSLRVNYASSPNKFFKNAMEITWYINRRSVNFFFKEKFFHGMWWKEVLVFSTRWQPSFELGEWLRVEENHSNFRNRSGCGKEFQLLGLN